MGDCAPARHRGTGGVADAHGLIRRGSARDIIVSNGREVLPAPAQAPEEVIINDEREPPRVTVNPVTEQLEMEYPCRWLYKLIGADETSLRQAVLEVIDVQEVTIELSNTSSGGNYVSINVAVRVSNANERTGFYESLRAHRSVRMVL